MTISIFIQVLPHGQNLPLPTYASADAAGVDLFSAINEPLLLPAVGGVLCVPAGFCMAIPPGFEAQIRPRSGLAAKWGVTVLNAPGTIDADYRGEIKVLLINHGKDDFLVERGMRIAQMVIAPVLRAQFKLTTHLSETERAQGGFGSTGMYAQEVLHE